MALQEELIARLRTLDVSEADRARLSRGVKQRKDFLKRFPLESLESLSLESYCIGRADHDNFCWWLEFGTADCSRISCGQCDHYCVYYEKKSHGYRLSKSLRRYKEEHPGKSDEEVARETVFEPLASFVKTKGGDRRICVYLGEGMLLKILILYYHDEFVEINSVKWLTKICEAFGLQSGGLFIEKNRIVKAFLDRQCEQLGDKNIPPQAMIAVLVDMLGLKNKSTITDDPTANVRFWRIQLHPNDAANFPAERILNKILIRHGVIGMGSEWDNDGGQPRQFREDVRDGDVVAVMDKIKEISDGLSRRWLRSGDGRWAPFLAEALKLPRCDLYYFFWNNPDEGPDEPGLFYTIADGTKLEVHYDTRNSEWYSDMDNAECELEELMRRCLNIAIESDIPNLVDDWLEIKANWDECRDANESTYHCCGDTLKFANSFCHGLMKIGSLIPLLKQKETTKVWKPASAEEAVRHYDEEGVADYEKRRKVVEDAFCTHARLPAVVSGDPFGFVLKKLKSEIEEMRTGVPQCPQDAACWQDVMKPILSYNPYISEYEAVSEDEESHITVEGANGEKYYLYGHSVDPPEKVVCRQIDELVGEYIKSGEKRARECGSRSHGAWVSALAGWKQSKLAWKLRSNQASIDAMVDKMKEAAPRHSCGLLYCKEYR